MLHVLLNRWTARIDSNESYLEAPGGGIIQQVQEALGPPPHLQHRNAGRAKGGWSQAAGVGRHGTAS